MSTNYYFEHKHKKDYSLKLPFGTLKFCPAYKKVFKQDLLHICKISYGWIPLFQSSEYFSSYTTFEEFYDKNKKYLKIIDEYDEEVSYGDLLQIINYGQFDGAHRSTSKRHTDVEVDEFGYEFTRKDFT